MRNLIIIVSILVSSISFAQGEVTPTVRKTVAKIFNFEVIQSGEQYIILYQDRKYLHIDAIKSITFDNKVDMFTFFDKVDEYMNTKGKESLEFGFAELTIDNEVAYIERTSKKYWLVSIRTNHGFAHLTKGNVKKLMKSLNKIR